MITFKAIIIPNNRRKDGTYPVKIRVTFKGVTRRLPTTLACTSGDLTRSLKIKSADILTRADELIARMRGAVKDLSPFDLDTWDVDRVVAHIKDALAGKSFRLDFFEWGDRFLTAKTESTGRTYANALNALERYLGKRELDINDISRAMLIGFAEFVDAEPKIHYNAATGTKVRSASGKIPGGASSRYLTKLRHIFDAAKDRFNDEDAGRILIPRSPFNKVARPLPPSVNGQKNLGRELMQKIISAETPDPSVRKALDTFVVSFGLMGANMADLYAAKPFTGPVWTYNRQKTRSRRADKAEMRVEIPPELDPYIARLRGRKGAAWWLSVLHAYAPNANRCTAYVNVALKRWCADNGVPPFTFYAARHSWASLARAAGIEKATIDEGLCHKGDYAMADIYAEKSWDLIWAANRKVLDLFQWPQPQP